MIWLALQVDIARRYAIACQVEICFNQWRSQKRGDNAASAIENVDSLGSDASGFREPFAKDRIMSRSLSKPATSYRTSSGWDVVFAAAVPSHNHGRRRPGQIVV